MIPSLKLTFFVPENGMVGILSCFLLGRGVLTPIFRCKLAVRFREGKAKQQVSGISRTNSQI